MKTALTLSILTLTSFLAAQEATHSVSPTTYFNMQQTQPKQAKPKSHTEQPTQDQKTAATQTTRSGQSEVMIINPETRAKDIQDAYQYLRMMSPASKLAVKLLDGSAITEILDMKVMPGGTIIIFRTNTLQGQKFQLVKVEDIDTITNV